MTVWVMAIICAKFNGYSDDLVPQYHKTCCTFERCEEFYMRETRNGICVKFLPIAGPEWPDFVHEFGIVKGDHWNKFYSRALPESMTLSELRDYWYDY